MKQSAVEFIKEELNRLGLLDKGQVMTNIFEQAKQIEKQQIIDAHLIGLITSLETEATKQATEYYTETYESKGSDEHIVDTNEMTSSQTEISEKPTMIFGEHQIQMLEISDEEIEKAFTIGHGFQKTVYTDRIEGAKWYREQLKQRQ